MNLSANFTKAVYQLIVRAKYKAVYEGDNFIELSLSPRTLVRLVEGPGDSITEQPVHIGCLLWVMDNNEFLIKAGAPSWYDLEILAHCGFIKTK